MPPTHRLPDFAEALGHASPCGHGKRCSFSVPGTLDLQQSYKPILWLIVPAFNADFGSSREEIPRQDIVGHIGVPFAARPVCVRTTVEILIGAGRHYQRNSIGLEQQAVGQSSYHSIIPLDRVTAGAQVEIVLSDGSH